MNMLTVSDLQASRAITNGPVISFEGVSVRYRVPHERVSGIKEFTIKWLQRQLVYDEFWALQNVSFNVERGETFAIVGRNGAGKSTSLKVIARVLQPTLGRVIIRGKVSPLLELGAGFNTELTGRENIYLNSALLGRSRKETDALFDSILDFSEISDFIDAPLRTYSTGMMARLGFAVATCFRPDVLLVDEVLSVGDARFQEKCMARMRSYRDQGTTILFVTHALGAVKDFCDRALWLVAGHTKAIGPAGEIADQYLAS
jgi:ABC-type polysaccharide/polyol phosphate transport system ATPase subunit